MAERIVYLHGVPHSGTIWQPFVWGAVGLLAATERPEAIERVAAFLGG
jgi:hypothetical protein